MPRALVDREPVERFTLPRVREAWAELHPQTIATASVELRLTVRMIKHRRQKAGPGEFPSPIPVVGHWNQAGQLYEADELALWKAAEFNLHNSKAAAKPLAAKVRRVARTVQPALLTGAAELLFAGVLTELTAAERVDGAAQIEAYRAEWESTGSKPKSTPEVLVRSVRRLRNWRETAASTGFPLPLPVAADYRAAETFFSLVELTAWLKARSAESN